MKKIMSKTFLDSSALFTSPSFGKGSARIVDLFGDLDGYNYKETEADADAEALRRDWNMVGLDIAQAIDAYDQSDSIETKFTTASTAK